MNRLKIGRENSKKSKIRTNIIVIQIFSCSFSGYNYKYYTDIFLL